MSLNRLPQALVLSTAMVLAGACFAQGYPTKPIRIITAETGGGSDFVSRVIVQGIGTHLGQPMVVDNRGGNSVIPGMMLVQAQPDGYTMLIGNSGLLIAPLLQTRAPYDATKDFAAVTYAAGAPNLLVVYPSIPVKSVQELIAVAKAKPGELNYSSGGPGSSNHIAAELFKAMAAVDVVHVPFKGTGPAVNALMGGQVQVMFPPVNSVMSHVKAGRLTGIAVTSAQPSALAPGFPTIASAGLAGYESISMYGVYVPPRTPKSIIARLNLEIVRALSQPEIKERLFRAGTETVGSPPEDLTEKVKSEVSRVGKVFKAARTNGG